MPYKPTGRPNGRPPSLPSNLGDLIMEDLKSRMDPVTRMVLPCLSALVRKLGVSRSSLKRTMRGLRDNGIFELVYVKKKPESKAYTIYYKIKESL